MNRFKRLFLMLACLIGSNHVIADYWLDLGGVKVSYEFGINDIRMTDYTFTTGSTVGGFPVDGYLRRGRNSFYVRGLEIPDVGEAGKDWTSQVMVRLRDRDLEFDLSADVMRFDLDDNGKALVNKPSGRGVEFLNISAMEKLPANPAQGRKAGYVVYFDIATPRHPAPHLKGQTMQLSPELEEQVNKELLLLTRLFEHEEYSTIAYKYRRAWAYTAKNYGVSTQYMANDQRKKMRAYRYFSLDLFGAKIQLQADGKLVGYSPAVIKANHRKTGRGIRLPVWFMQDKDGSLHIAKMGTLY